MKKNFKILGMSYDEYCKLKYELWKKHTFRAMGFDPEELEEK